MANLKVRNVPYLTVAGIWTEGYKGIPDWNTWEGDAKKRIRQGLKQALQDGEDKAADPVDIIDPDLFDQLGTEYERHFNGTYSDGKKIAFRLARGEFVPPKPSRYNPMERALIEAGFEKQKDGVWTNASNSATLTIKGGRVTLKTSKGTQTLLEKGKNNGEVWSAVKKALKTLNR